MAGQARGKIVGLAEKGTGNTTLQLIFKLLLLNLFGTYILNIVGVQYIRRSFK